MSRSVKVPAGGATLRAVVTHDERGDFDLIVKVGGEELLEKTIGPDVTEDGWAVIEVDLSKYAGKMVAVGLVNQPNGWQFEAAYWAEVKVVD